MNEILECRFMRILLRGKKHDYDPNYLLAAYTDFRSVLLGVSDGDMHYKDKFRTLKSTYEILDLRVQSTQFINERGSHTQTYASLALKQMLVELELLEKQLQYPTLFPATKAAGTRRESPLYWNTENHSKTALISLLTALDAVGACTDSKGNRSPFISIVQEFEHLFNTTIPNAYARRDELLGRGESRVRFIRELLRSLGAE